MANQTPNPPHATTSRDSAPPAHEVRPASGRSDERTRVLKHGDTFAIFDELGDIDPARAGTYGIYHGGTRFLSSLLLTLEGRAPVRLGSAISRDNMRLEIDLTTPPLTLADGAQLPGAEVHLFRTLFLWDGCCYEQLRVRSHHREPIAVRLRFQFEADFADIFELRGQSRARRGQPLPPRVEASAVTLRYRGLDNMQRQAQVRAHPAPTAIGVGHLEFWLDLTHGQERELQVIVACESDELPVGGHGVLPRDRAQRAAGREHETRCAGRASLRSGNELFNEWLDRSVADLDLLLTQTPSGLYPYAGIPWFNTPFGRDGILTGLETLWFFPDLSRGVLEFLASTQAHETDPDRDAEPGKILHEMRYGEMAATREVPFGRYYGSVDATPLFVMLAHEYYQRTADADFIRKLWPAVRAAVGWIERFGDVDGDGFIEYSRTSADGLMHQGWKDSGDAVFHADGSLAPGPIALCEVQGYAYAALQAAAQLALVVGDPSLAATLTEQSSNLRERFEDRFYCDDLGTYALAIDGKSRPCAVRSSNAGHCLYTGICTPDRAKRVVETLMSPEMYSGWGVRTIGLQERAYNPMGYHLGSVWPHDNAILAAGMARYGYKAEAMQILSALFDASNFMEVHRMPELFCGFLRRQGQGPTLYPVACAPQAWAAGAVFMLLGACLGLRVDALRREVLFERPVLPDWLERLEIDNISVGGATLGLALERTSMDVAVQLVRRRGDASVSVVKRA